MKKLIRHFIENLKVVEIEEYLGPAKVYDRIGGHVVLPEVKYIRFAYRGWYRNKITSYVIRQLKRRRSLTIWVFVTHIKFWDGSTVEVKSHFHGKDEQEAVEKAFHHALKQIESKKKETA